MVSDVIPGTASGEGLQQLVEDAGVNDVSKYYKALVLYSPGVLPEWSDLGDGDASACVASDFANRLMGWTGIAASGFQIPLAMMKDFLTLTHSGENNDPTGEKSEGAPADSIFWYVQSAKRWCCRSIEEAHGTALRIFRKLNKGVYSNCRNLRNNVN
jgi:hypothetical protein